MAKISKNEIVVIDGLDELIKATSKLGEDAKAYLVKAANDAGEIVKARAIAKAPIRNGPLKRNIKLTKATTGKKGTMLVSSKVGVGKAHYGIPLELGHKMVLFGIVTNKRVSEKPYLRPAADESKEDVARIMTSAMNEALEKMGGKE